ncbi:hypothetical protein KJ671_03155 [Patescibacteria group bacterium]|nr:hypothetical protein [Patescibacteria group bacterium]
MEIQNNNTNSEKIVGKSYIKHILTLLVMIIVVGGGYWSWNNYLSPLAKINAEEKQRIEAYDKYLDIFRNDTYGGQTPQETLDLFVEALEKGDMELASKYFMQDDDGSVDEWRKGLLAMNNEQISGAINLIRKGRLVLVNNIGDKIVAFELYDTNDELGAYIELANSGKLWKIRSL